METILMSRGSVDMNFLFTLAELQRLVRAYADRIVVLLADEVVADHPLETAQFGLDPGSTIISTELLPVHPAMGLDHLNIPVPLGGRPAGGRSDGGVGGAAL